MCEPNKHKFRTNIDNLHSVSKTDNVSSIHTQSTVSPYVTIIFCERCGFIVHDKNSSINQFLLNNTK